MSSLLKFTGAQKKLKGGGFSNNQALCQEGLGCYSLLYIFPLHYTGCTTYNQLFSNLSKLQQH